MFATEITERSYAYELRDLETGKVLESRLRSPNEAAEYNYGMRGTNKRWLPAAPSTWEREALRMG